MIQKVLSWILLTDKGSKGIVSALHPQQKKFMPSIKSIYSIKKNTLLDEFKANSMTVLEVLKCDIETQLADVDIHSNYEKYLTLSQIHQSIKQLHDSIHRNIESLEDSRFLNNHEINHLFDAAIQGAKILVNSSTRLHHSNLIVFKYSDADVITFKLKENRSFLQVLIDFVKDVANYCIKLMTFGYSPQFFNTTTKPIDTISRDALNIKKQMNELMKNIARQPGFELPVAAAACGAG